LAPRALTDWRRWWWCRWLQAGTFAAAIQQTACDVCVPGKYSNASEASGCYGCDAGRFQGKPGLSSCDLCAPGKNSPSGQAECDLCGKRTIAPDAGSSTCLFCALNADSTDDRTICVCAAGFYQPQPEPGAVSVPCTECPDGAKCVEKGQTWKSLQTVAGWWREVTPEASCHSIGCCLEAAALLIRRPVLPCALRTT
jgi:hypothetical protein